MGRSGGGGSGKAVDQRLLKLQEELTEMHRKKGEVSLMHANCSDV